MPRYQQGNSFSDRPFGSTAVATSRSGSSAARTTTRAYQSGNSFSDRPFGADSEQIVRSIRALTGGNRRRNKGRLLDPLGAPTPIDAERTTVPRDVGGDGTAGVGGLVSPIRELVYAGETFYLNVDSTGLFTDEYPAETEFEDAVGNRETRQWLPP